MVFSNLPELELFVNGERSGKQTPDEYATFIWENVNLSEGENVIEVRSTTNKSTMADKVIITCK